MAEFCLECWNKINETQDSQWRYLLSLGKDLCEECGQYKKVIIRELLWSRTQRTVLEAIEDYKNRKNG